MSGPKHTPGPWEVRRGSDGYIRQVVGPKGRIVSRWNGLAAPTSNEGEANALLIAAAPDLLACLEQMVERHEALGRPDDGWDGLYIDEAKAAIAKAKGETA